MISTKHIIKGNEAENQSFPKNLKKEFQRTREELLLTIEEMQTSQEELKSTNEKLQTTNDELSKSENNYHNLLKEKELILKEVHHRIKNNMNVIFSLLNLQATNEEISPAKTVLLDAAGRIQSMMVLYDKLYRSENETEISIKEYFPSLINEIVNLFPQKDMVKVDTEIDDILLSPNKLSPLGIIINELITNAMKYAFTGNNDGTITVTASKKENRVSIMFEDSGTGIPETITFENSTGFGLQLISMLVKQMDGSITIDRQRGTKFTIEFEN